MFYFLRLKPISLLLAVLSGLWLTPALAGQTWPLNVITALSQEDPLYQGLLRFKAILSEKTDGQVPVRIFYGSQLGSDEDILEQARAGANVAVVIDGGRLSVYTPEFAVLGAPYLVNSREQARKLVLSPIFDGFAQSLSNKAGLRVLSFNWWQGERHVLAQKPAKTPGDLKGVRMRTIGAPVFIEAVRALGATPTPLAWAEVYPGLSQGVIDGAEAQHQATYGSKLFEVISDITKTGHIQLLTGIVVSQEWFDALPAKLQQDVVSAAIVGGDYASDLAFERQQEYEQKMQAAGVTIHTIDKTPFRKASQAVYQKLGLEELRGQINEYLDTDAKVRDE